MNFVFMHGICNCKWWEIFFSWHHQPSHDDFNWLTVCDNICKQNFADFAVGFIYWKCKFKLPIQSKDIAILPQGAPEDKRLKSSLSISVRSNRWFFNTDRESLKIIVNLKLFYLCIPKCPWMTLKLISPKHHLRH